MNKEDIDKLKKSKGTFNFNGCLVTQIIGGWKLFDTVCATPDEVEQVLSNAYKAIEKSIINPATFTVKSGFSVTNTDEKINEAHNSNIR